MSIRRIPLNVERLPDKINLGRGSENEAVQLAVDVSAWVNAWPACSISINFLRPFEDIFYTVSGTLDGGLYTYEVTDTDTAIAGTGTLELVCTEDGKLAASAVARYVIEERLLGTQSPTPPEPVQSWYTRALQAADDAEGSAQRAETAAESIESVTRIPSAYKHVEYLDNGGTAYIDIAEPLTGDSRVFAVFALNSVPTASTKPVFGWYRGSYDSYAIVAQNGNWMYRYGNQATLQLLKNDADTNIHVLDFNKGTIALDGTVCADNDELEFTAGSLFRLFGSQSGVAAQRIVGDVKIYRFDWYKGNTLVHSYIPVERVADGVLGLWDLVEEAFITATAGTFSKGYNINLLNNALAIDELKAAVANGVTQAQMDALDAQITYTAMMTDTLL